jgi:sugar lactone lactonase YvrE
VTVAKNVAVGCAVALSVLIHAQQTDVPAGVAKNEEAPPVAFERPPVTADGFRVTVLVPPGTMYDPGSVLPRPDGSVWVGDDGGVGGNRGGVIWSVDKNGKVTKLVDEYHAMPTIGVDLAPKGFGKWGGELMWVAAPTVVRSALSQPYIVQHVKPNSGELSQTVCTLPYHGTVTGGLPASGTDVRFGPAGTPFANRLFVVTTRNNTIYQVTPDGVCTPFVTVDSGPHGVAFPLDGSKMYVSMRRGTQGSTGRSRAGTIVSVSPDGLIDGTPVFDRAESSMMKRVMVAPRNFGVYSGQIFFTDHGPSATEGPDKSVKWDGSLWRVGGDGIAHLVASGFSNPMGFAFAGQSIYVADINRDGPYFEGKWVADGFLVRLDLAK